MKIKRIALTALGITAIYGLASCGGDKDHDHGHDHAGHADHDEADHDEADHDKDGGEDHGHDHGHDHEEIIAGPNGGRVLTIVEPHAEFFVTEERKVQIAFVDDDSKTVAAGEQIVTVIAGDRKAPTTLAFQKSGDVLISDKSLPEGNDFPIIVQIKTGADVKSVRAKFNLNMDQCPTCDNREYACTCDHDEE